MAAIEVSLDAHSIFVLTEVLWPTAAPGQWKAVDIASDFQIRATSFRSSPINLLLGLDGSPTRLLALAVELGVEWAATILERDHPKVGSVITGSHASELVDSALVHRANELDELKTLAESFRDPRAIDDRAHGDLRRLNDVLATTQPAATFLPLGDGRTRLAPSYRCEDALSAAAVELLLMNNAGRLLLTCGHCQCLFFPYLRSDELYCQRPATGELLYGAKCRDVGPQQRYREQLDPLNALYRRTYKLLDSRQRRGHMDRHQVDQWRTAARALLVTARNRKWSVERFERELRKIRPNEEEMHGSR